MKACKNCGDLWNEDAFPNGGNIGRPCSNAEQRERYQRNKGTAKHQARLERMNRYYHENYSLAIMVQSPRVQECPQCHIKKGHRAFDGHKKCLRCRNMDK